MAYSHEYYLRNREKFIAKSKEQEAKRLAIWRLAREGDEEALAKRAAYNAKRVVYENARNRRLGKRTRAEYLASLPVPKTAQEQSREGTARTREKRKLAKAGDPRYQEWYANMKAKTLARVKRWQAKKKQNP